MGREIEIGNGSLNVRGWRYPPHIQEIGTETRTGTLNETGYCGSPVTVTRSRLGSGILCSAQRQQELEDDRILFSYGIDPPTRTVPDSLTSHWSPCPDGVCWVFEYSFYVRRPNTMTLKLQQIIRCLRLTKFPVVPTYIIES